MGLVAESRRLKPLSRLPRLFLMTDAARGGDPVAAASRLPPARVRGCGPGWAAVVLRHDGVPGRERLAAQLARLCRSRGLCFLVARDGRLALRFRAGLHLADGMRPPLCWRRRGGLLTVAAHGPRALRRAKALHADLALLSPLFPTLSHPGAPALGPVRFASLVGRAGLAVAALGGLAGGWRARAARRAGAAAFAAVGALAAPLLQLRHGVP